MTQYAPVAAAVVILILLTVPQAVITDRFTKIEATAEQQAMAARIKRVAEKYKNIGDWVGTLEEIDPTSRKVARIVGDFSVRYQNKNDPNQSVNIMLVCGRGKDMGDHTPDQCYIASGFTMVDHEVTYTMDLAGGTAQFTTCRFRKDIAGQGSQNIRIFWSFNEDGKWFATPTLRMELARKPALYKLYATTGIPRDTKEAPSQSIADPFLKEFLPLIQAELFPPAGEKPAEGNKESSPGATPTDVAPADAAPSK
jgi:hypothetical protein